ncbi:MAG TPA: LCP family protein [Pseudonocardiaceae bacterium]|nr:LCP family protein [Pseudonocardiaceae bacterium]
MDDWPRDPEDRGRSRDGAQPPRSGNLPEPPRSGDLGDRLNPGWPGEDGPRRQPNQRQPNQRQPGQRQPGERQPGQRQPGRGNPPGTGARLPRPNADSVRGRIPSEANPNASRVPTNADPNATRRTPNDPNATRRVPNNPDLTSRVPNNPDLTSRVRSDAPSSATRRNPARPPADATRRVSGQRPAPRADDAGPTRMVRSEAPDALEDEAPRRRGMSRGAKIALNAGKVVLALAAVVVLGLTGVSWAELQKAENGVTTDNVIDGGDNGAKHADGAEDILLVGLDSRTDVQGNALPPQVLASLGAGDNGGEVNTDTMILLHIPDNGGPAVGISIPRDSWVNIPGYQTNKINAAYADAKGTSTKQLKAQGDTDPADVERKSSQAGAKELISVIQNLAGVHIDHYAEVNLYGFDQLSQAIGGVPVCLNHAVHDDNSGANFQAGYFTVQGVQALQFVRQRHGIPGGSTDLQREARQQAFLASMAHKVLSAGTLTSPTELNNLIGAIQKSIIIDSGWNLVDFAGQMAGMSSGNIKFETIPTVNIDYHPVKGSNLSAVQIDPAQVAAFVKGQLGGTSSPPPSNVGSTSNPSSTNAPAGTGNSATTVDVQNGSGVHNLAAGVLTKLTKAGFGQGTTGNIANRTSSIIYFHAGQQDAANAVASALGGKVTVAQSPSVPSGHVWVYLGSHYTTEGITTAASISGASNEGVVPAAFVPAHQADPSSISDSGNAPPCVD